MKSPLVGLLLWSYTSTAFLSPAVRTASSFRLNAAASEDDQAKKLLEKAAKLREEIAQMEGKSVSQVEEEAREKKERAARAAQATQKAIKEEKSTVDWGKMLNVPGNADEMITQAARAIERAYKDGITRQTVRLALVEEEQEFTDINPWPGGAQQMYREAGKPLTRKLLREIRTNPEQVMFPEIKDQDIWDFDGSGLVTSEAKLGPEDDVQALVFPNTDTKYLEDIKKIDGTMGDRLFLLINPFWRNIDSWGINLLAPGAKNKAKEIVFDRGYDETYVLLRFSVRGEDCVALKCYPYDWQLFANLEDDFGYVQPVRLGSSPEEPKSDLITKLLNERPEFKLSKTMRRITKGQ